MKIKDVARSFKALSHPHRLAIFLRLAQCCREQDCDAETCSTLCVGELGAGLGIGASTVSHHLKELQQAGLVSTRRCGQSIECWVAEATLDDLSHFFLNAKNPSSSTLSQI